MTPDFRAQLQRGLGDSYVLERELAGGGMSRVFVAEETSLARKIVVKVLPPETAAEVSVERFKREISFAARLQHPHIVPLLAAGEAAGLPYFTMPFIEGESLRVRIAREGELPVADGVRILREVAAALDYAHDQGIVHRDIKPDNVLLSRGSAMVTDFGVAKALSASTNAEQGGVTSIGLALGTPAYMAPEQAAASPTIDNRADIYAFGVLAFELFGGRTPFAGRSPHAMLAAHVTEAPELIGNLRPTLPRPLAVLIMRCLEKHAADRPQAAEIVHALDAITTPSGASEPAATMGVRTLTLPGRRITGVRIGAGTVAVGLVAATAWQLLGSTKDNPVGSAASRAIAVLPFENIGGDTANAYFGVGMADAVTSALSKVAGLTLRAIRTAPASRDPQEIGRVQQVFAVVDGKVHKAGDRLRMSASLTRVSDGAVLWSETYTRSAADVFAVQDEVSRAIAGALEAKLGAALVTAPTKDLEAYDLYLKGRYLWNQRTKSSLEAAIVRFKAAIGRDSTFALAYVGLADALIIMPQYAETRASDSFRLADAVLGNALTLDPDNAEAHASLGLLQSNQYNWKRAEDEFQRAIALRPQYATSHHWYSLNLLYRGRVAEATEQIKLGKQLDPTSRVIATVYALIVQASGDVDRAIVEYGKVIELGTFAEAHRRLARAFALKGDYVAAEAEVNRALATSGLPENGDLGYVLAKSGRRAEAQRLVEALVDRSTREYVSPGSIGLVYLGLGDNDRALEWFARSVEDKDQRTRELLTDRRFDPLRSDPRFRALLVTMNLPPG